MLTAAAVTYSREVLDGGLWDEIAPLLEAHWHEVAHYPDLALAPRRDLYEKIADAGNLRVYTARVDAGPTRGRLVGYLAALVTPSLHYAPHVYAQQDVLFVDKSHRGSRVGVDLIRFAHDQLRAEGVTALYQHVKHRSDLNVGPMLERLLGYEHVDDIYAVRLDRSR